MNTTEAIALKKAEAKFTRTKNAIDGSAAKEKAYQKAKHELDVLRRSLRTGRTPHGKSGDAVATPTTLKVKATDPKKKGS